MHKRLYSWDNLLLAYRKASRKKRGKGNVAAFEHMLEDNLLALQADLVSRSYAPGGYTSFFIHEPKRRLISAAPFRDRVVHHALCNLIEPAFERSFVADSFANRVGKGTHRCLDHIQQLARRFPFILQCDLRQFFPSLDHVILFDILTRKITDPAVQELIQLIIDSGTGLLTEEYEMVYFPGDDLFAKVRPRGLPIGNLTSQFWANCYMNPFDHFVKRELGCKGYARYVDDFWLFGETKEELWQWKSRIEDRLATLRLTMHPGAHPRPVQEGIPALGFIIFPERRRLKSRKGFHYRRKLQALMEDFADGLISIEKLNASVNGWVNHVSYGNTVGLRKALFQACKI